jgi:hypothetical protein
LSAAVGWTSAIQAMRVDDLISAVKRHVDVALESLDGAIRQHVESSLGPHGDALAKLPEMMTLLEEARDERVYRRKREEEAAAILKHRKDEADIATAEAEANAKRWKGRAIVIGPILAAVTTIAIEAVRSYAH